MQKTHVLMYAWEFPPYISGGLGMACYGLSNALSRQENIQLSLILPHSDKKQPDNAEKLKSLKTAQVISAIDALSSTEIPDPYGFHAQYPHIPLTVIEAHEYHIQSVAVNPDYNEHLLDYVNLYAERGGKLAKKIPHDVIQCHDWLTVQAGILAKKISRKPLIFHVHALEIDRNFGHLCQHIYQIEREGMQIADQIVAVSHYTKQRIIEHYQISEHKITVVHNGIDQGEKTHYEAIPSPSRPRKLVLFAGRMTEQKGVSYFIETAKKILQIRRDIEFLIAGKGEQYNWSLHHIAELGLSEYIQFTGFLDQNWVKTAFKFADVFIMPSRSEPFGLVALEAILHDTPVIFSKQSGACEIFTQPITVDYWDTEKMAQLVLDLIDQPSYTRNYLKKLKKEIRHCTWQNAANTLTDLYQRLTESS